MHIKKLFKRLPITVMVVGLAAATSTPLILLNNTDYPKNQILNSNSQVTDTDHSDQLDYIRNDVAKQTGALNSIKSIEFATSALTSDFFGTLVTKTNGSTLLYMWGENYSGQLGNGTTNNTSTPTLVDSTLFGSRKITQIAFGGYHSAALLEDGSLYMWGSNYSGQLGNGTSGSGTNASTPTLVDSTLFGSRKVTQIALGFYHSAALLEDGSLYMWGSNFTGGLGNGSFSSTEPIPLETDTTSFTDKIDKIFLGYNFSAALLEDGSLYMWGDNNYGQLGINSIGNKPIPMKATTNFSYPIKQMALGELHSAAILEDGSLYMWGSNWEGQLCFYDADKVEFRIPTLIDSKYFNFQKIVQISLGDYSSAAITEDGSLYMWGRNSNGHLGPDGWSPGNTAVRINPYLNSKKIAQIRLGMSHSAALTEDGSMYMWGSNNSGQLGFAANSVANPKPIWMSQLGMNSYIKANNTITAQAAVDNMWVDNKFNLTGFKNSFSLINIPEITAENITMTKQPVPDNVTGTVTMTVKIKYFYNEDGLRVPDTTAEEMTITGFSLPPPPVTENQNPTTENQNAFPWWWILIGIGGAIIIAVGIWHGVKKHRARSWLNSIKETW